MEISVIIPTYNRAKLLPRAIKSVLKQTFTCQEIIIVDDGSTDETAEIIREIIEKSFIKIHYFYQENKGVAAARNLGIKKSSYNMIAFLDSDDHWHKRKLAKQTKAMLANPEYLISHTCEKWLRRGEHLNQKKIHIPRHGNIFDHCLQLCAVGMSTVVVNKELFKIVGMFNEDMPCCEDYDLWLRTSAKFPFLLIDEKLITKEGGREDQLSVIHRIGMDKYRIDSIIRLLSAKQLSTQYQQLAENELKKKCTIYVNGCLKHNKLEEAEKYNSLTT